MASREPELYKDKIEVSLDGRQIFYLFFGGAVIVGMVFVLGVMVGRRVEARGHLDRADPQAVSDPLAALDRLERSDKLSFHGALTGSEAPTEVEKAIGELEKRRTGAARPEPRSDSKLESKLESKPDARPDSKPDPAARSEAVTRPDADKPRPDKHDGDKAGDKAEKKPHKHDDAGSDGGKSEHDARKPAAHGEPVTRPDARSDARSPGTEGKSEGKTEGKQEARADSKPDGKDIKADAKDGKPDGKASADKVRFTLQLSSFQDRSEAEAFLGSIKSAGFQPYLTEADVTGKGTFYRIRLGSYRSLDAANDAKAEYEKASRKTAQVMRL